MKKGLLILVAVCMSALLLPACAGGEGEAPAATPAPTAAESPKPLEIEAVPEADDPGGDTGVDVDLTKLSSTMVYGEVFNMMSEPESYAGKTIKARGQYYANYYEPTSQYYHFVIIQDAAACCAQGLEFVWLGEHAYPEDYPKDNTLIEIAGVWESYEEDGQTYYHIKTESVKAV